ncbi:MAG: type II secretion system F family protein [Candidatus Omnitrophica bacterium]|nr:type II secretion system F family protein [Candidatus Omnitrophota bacterium]
MFVKALIFLVVFGVIFFLVTSAYPAFEILMKRWRRKRMDNITPKLDHMFLDITLQKLMFLDVLVPVIFGIIAVTVSRNIWIVLGAIVLGLIIPIFVIKKLESIRRNKFAGQIVDVLMILSSCLKAGLSMTQALEVVVEEMPSPANQEFGLVTRQMQMGVSLEDAMNSLRRRMKVSDLDMVVTAMMVARESGGDLTETFSRLVFTIQERNKLISRVKALCVQGKLQGAIMSLLPIFFALFVYKVNPHFFDIFFEDNFGRMLFAYAIISEIMGIIFIRKLSKVDI